MTRREILAKDIQHEHLGQFRGVAASAGSLSTAERDGHLPGGVFYEAQCNQSVLPNNAIRHKQESVHRTYRYPLNPTKAQSETLSAWLRGCQQLYNACIQERRDAWKKQRVSVGYNQQTKELTQLRHSMTEWKAVPITIARSAISRCDRSFQAFYRRVKAGDKPGFPRFKSASRYNTIGLGRVRAEDSHVLVPKLGPVRFHEYRELKGKILNVEITRDGDQWFVCFVCDLGEAPPKVAIKEATGIDLGLSAFVALADGTSVDAPKHFRASESALAKKQRVCSRRKKGSARRCKAAAAVRRVHAKIRNQRLDFQRKLACSLFAQYDLIAHENLNVKGLAAGMLAKSVNDAGWSQFIGILTCKAESAGKWIVPVDPRGTSQRCSSCGCSVPKTLNDRVHRCDCGLVLDRDHNAALNVLSLIPVAYGESKLVESDQRSVKREVFC